MFISLLTALTFAGASEDLSRPEIDTLTALSTWCGTPRIDASVAQIAERAHYSEDAVKKALASLEDRGIIIRTQRSDGFKRLSSIIYVDWRAALKESARDDYDRLADAGDSYNFPSSRENNPHLWGDATEPPAPQTAKSSPPKRAPKKKQQVPDNWSPSEKARQWTTSTFPSMPVALELQKFIAYHQAKGSLFADIDKAWRSWCLNGNGYANGAWAQQAATLTNAPAAAEPVINPDTGQPLTENDFGLACIDMGIEPTRYIHYWKPYMGLPSDPGWPEWAAKIDKHCGRA